MDDFVTFGSKPYLGMLAVLLFGRSMDILSTWMATPNLVLEGNPIAKLLGWRWGVPVNFLLCIALAFWPLPAIILSTTSVLVAARNFQSAWLMRTLGEEGYRVWHVQRIKETRMTMFMLSLGGNTLLTAAVGAGVIYFSGKTIVLFGIGVGIVAYAAAVAFYTMLALFRLRRNELRRERRRQNVAAAAFANAPAPETLPYFSEEAPGK